jgi:hypothetical protein
VSFFLTAFVLFPNLLLDTFSGSVERLDATRTADIAIRKYTAYYSAYMRGGRGACRSCIYTCRRRRRRFSGGRLGSEGDLSEYLAEIVVKEVSEEDWPKGFFEEVLGNWEGEIERSA